jgi:DNA polymerase
MRTLEIDIETYSEENLGKCGVYRYAESKSFEILLFGYSIDSGPVVVVDLASGETIPDEVLDALSDDSVTKWAFNATFERVCLSSYLGRLGRTIRRDDPGARYLDPSVLTYDLNH